MFRSQFLKSQSIYGNFSKKFFSNFDYDLCIIGGGPAGKIKPKNKKDISLLLRLGKKV
jgi:hypothetical protein